MNLNHKPRIKVPVAITICSAFLASAANTMFAQSSSNGEKSDAEITTMLAQCAEQNRAPGIVVGVIDEKGARIFETGVFDDEDARKVDGDTVFEIGSATKVFTALLLQDMVQRGEVKLDDPISKYLPASVKSPKRNGREITLVDLATQTSALPRLPDNLDMKDFDNPYADYTAEKLYEYLSSCELKRDIGSKYEYSNLGAGLLGHVLSLAAKTDYETLVKQRICAPLHMDSTVVKFTPEIQQRLAPGHNATGFAAHNWDLNVLTAAGGLRSTVNDLVKFVAANAGLSNSPLATAMKATQQPRHETSGAGKIGLIWQIQTSTTTIWHNGGTGGYRSYIGFKTNPRRGVVVLANSANDVDDIGQYLLGDRAEIKDFQAPKRHKLAKIDPKVYDDYLGVYEFSGAPLSITVTREKDRLFAQMTGQDKFEVFPESKTDFFYKIVDAQLTFKRGDKNEISELVLHQNGMDQELTRAK